jgi:prophage regulatory protein
MTNSKQQSQSTAAHGFNARPNLPPTGFLRLPQVLAVFPISRSQWYAGVKSGRYPQGVKLGPRTTAWPVASIAELIDTLGSAKCPPPSSTCAGTSANVRSPPTKQRRTKKRGQV